MWQVDIEGLLHWLAARWSSALPYPTLVAGQTHRAAPPHTFAAPHEVRDPSSPRSNWCRWVADVKYTPIARCDAGYNVVPFIPYGSQPHPYACVPLTAVSMQASLVCALTALRWLQPFLRSSLMQTQSPQSVRGYRLLLQPAHAAA